MRFRPILVLLVAVAVAGVAVSLLRDRGAGASRRSLISISPETRLKRTDRLLTAFPVPEIPKTLLRRSSGRTVVDPSGVAAREVDVADTMTAADVSAYLAAVTETAREVDAYLAAVHASEIAAAEVAARPRTPAPATRSTSGSVGVCGGATNGADQYIGRESGGNPAIFNAGGSGAYGCYQIMPGTWSSSCADLGPEIGSSPSTQAACASRLPLSAWR